MAKASPPASAPASDDAPRKSSKLGWVIGWIVVPLLCVSALFLGGVHVGARHPQMWFSRALLWMASAEAQLGPQTGSEHDQSIGQRLRLMALPSKDITLRLSFSEAELQAIAKRIGVSPDKLECEAVCRDQWEQGQVALEYLGAARCVLTPASKDALAKLDCDAKVERGAW